MNPGYLPWLFFSRVNTLFSDDSTPFSSKRTSSNVICPKGLLSSLAVSLTG